MFGRIDILVHNAGLVVFEAIETIDEAHYQRMLDVHVNAHFWLVQAAMPHMRTQGYGHIVLTTRAGRSISTARFRSSAPTISARWRKSA